MNSLAPYLDPIMDKCPELKKFCRMVRRRLEEDWDITIGIEGEEGSSKTALGILISYGIDPENFHLDRNIAYLPSYKDIEKKFNDLPQYSVLDVDEAVKVLYKLRWMNTLQQKINEMYMTERKQNKATLLLIPRFIDLNEHFRNHRVKIRIWVVDRGVAIAYLRDKDKDTRDVWHIKENVDIKEKWFRRKAISIRTNKDLIEAERRTMNYWFEFSYPDLPKEVWLEYKHYYSYYRTVSKATDIGETQGIRLQKYMDATTKLVLYLRDQHKLTYEKLSELTGLSKMSINRLVNVYSLPVTTNNIILNTDKSTKEMLNT